MPGSPRSRRRVGRSHWLAATAILVVGTAALLAYPPREGDEPLPGHDAPSRIVIAPPEEPGERLVVRGRVFAPDGKTPVEGGVLYVYHTGEDGRYAPPGQRVPRLRGWVRTDEDGRYEYETIRPGAYPGSDTPAHVHVFLWGAGYEPQWTEDVNFADDPLLPKRILEESRDEGPFGRVCDPGRTEEGELLCVRHYRLKPEGDPMSEVPHAFVGPGEG